MVWGNGHCVLQFCGKLCWRFPALFVWNLFLPLFGLVYAQLTAEVILAAVAIVTLSRLSRELELKFRADEGSSSKQKNGVRI